MWRAKGFPGISSTGAASAASPSSSDQESALSSCRQCWLHQKGLQSHRCVSGWHRNLPLLWMSLGWATVNSCVRFTDNLISLCHVLWMKCSIGCGISPWLSLSMASCSFKQVQAVKCYGTVFSQQALQRKGLPKLYVTATELYWWQCIQYNTIQLSPWQIQYLLGTHLRIHWYPSLWLLSPNQLCLLGWHDFVILVFPYYFKSSLDIALPVLWEFRHLHRNRFQCMCLPGGLCCSDR